MTKEFWKKLQQQKTVGYFNFIHDIEANITAKTMLLHIIEFNVVNKTSSNQTDSLVFLNALC